MADKANGKKGISKIEAVRQALTHFHGDATPTQMRPWIKQQFGLDLSNDLLSTYKADIRRQQTKKDGAKATTPLGSASAPAAPSAPSTAPSPTTTKSATTAKPVAKKPMRKKPTAKPQGKTPTPSAGSSQGTRQAGGISLPDIESVKHLVKRVGAGPLRTLIDLLAT